MKINIETPSFAADSMLLLFIEKKLAKLDQFYDRIVCADVFLKVQKTSEKENKYTEILLSIPGGDLMVKKGAKSFEEATNECVHSLERLLKKRKDKLRAFL